jgi:PAS domain S-box-containing protein
LTEYASEFAAMEGDVEAALEHINIPSYVIDTNGIIRWTNVAAQQAVGDVSGQPFTAVVAPEDVRRAREAFASKILGTTKVTDAEVVLFDEDGNRISVEISSVPLKRGGHVIGVFGQIVHDAPAPPPHEALTPRQAQILSLLEHGRSTRQIAGELHISVETVRNHVRHLLRTLDCHSRLEAVAIARREHLVPD